jgi:hypothetical protein
MAAEAIGSEASAVAVAGADEHRGALAGGDDLVFSAPGPQVVAGRAAQPGGRITATNPPRRGPPGAAGLSLAGQRGVAT